ncbi:hypothetical protein V1477_020520 [Vespula maculifrons]|uniref:Uncharacterized protein n=1 Tax=Vespula maculifrons TaxID=7453 RepID=A0ABD2APX3_VESMC
MAFYRIPDNYLMLDGGTSVSGSLALVREEYFAGVLSLWVIFPKILWWPIVRCRKFTPRR